MATHRTMTAAERERLRAEWMQRSAQAFERMFADDQQQGLVTFTQREDRAVDLGGELARWLVEEHVAADPVGPAVGRVDGALLSEVWPARDGGDRPGGPAAGPGVGQPGRAGPAGAGAVPLYDLPGRLFPLDVTLALDPEGYSPRVLRMLVRQGARAASFADAGDDLAALAGVVISPKHLERLTERLGAEWAAARDADVAALRAGRLGRDYPQPPGPGVAAAVMLDGGRAQTRADGHGPGVHEPGWRETKVACCLTLESAEGVADPQPRPPAGFLDPPGVARLVQQVKARGHGGGGAAAHPGRGGAGAKNGTGKKKRRRGAAGKGAKKLVRTAVATMADSEAFGWQVMAEVHRRGLDRAARKACVCDGQRYNWSIYEMHLEPAGFVGILDVLHLLTYLYAAAGAAAGRGTVKAWALYERWLRGAWAGDVAGVLKELTAAAARLGPPREADEQDPRRVAADAVTYVTNNRHRMDYPRYRKLGLPTSSAPVESLIKQFNRRVKGSEKFWLTGGAEAVLQVRAAYLSEDGRADRYWDRPRPRQRAAGHGPLPRRKVA